MIITILLSLNMRLNYDYATNIFFLGLMYFNMVIYDFLTLFQLSSSIIIIFLLSNNVIITYSDEVKFLIHILFLTIIPTLVYYPIAYCIHDTPIIRIMLYFSMITYLFTLDNFFCFSIIYNKITKDYNKIISDVRNSYSNKISSYISVFTTRIIMKIIMMKINKYNIIQTENENITKKMDFGVIDDLND